MTLSIKDVLMALIDTWRKLQHSVIVLSVIMLSVNVLFAVMLSVVMLTVIMLSDVAIHMQHLIPTWSNVCGERPKPKTALHVCYKSV
jgi:hypothetical protein